MPRRPHRPLIAVALVATLLAALTPLPVAAAPADGAGHLLFQRFAHWIEQITAWPASTPSNRQTAALETIPVMDPDGAASEPPATAVLDPSAPATQQPGNEGETIPVMDPDG